jgi:hypothetical protein
MGGADMLLVSHALGLYIRMPSGADHDAHAEHMAASLWCSCVVNA